MLETLNKTYPFNDNLKTNVRSIVGISLGIFLFLLFFQPLVPQNPDFNNKLLILAGFGVITLILLGLLRITIPSVFPTFFSVEKWTLKKEISIDLLFIIVNSVAFVFFARFVGKIAVNFHITVLIVLISIASLVVLVIINEFRYLKNQVEFFNKTIKQPDTTKNIAEEDIEIDFESENKSEYFRLFLNQIILIKSANNYIEVIYIQEQQVSHRLIRNTLKNTEQHFSKYPSLIRCHRSYIVNKNFIQNITKGTDGLILHLLEYPNEIHVSRQYVLTVKEALKLP